jgi:hypothetical protein
MYRWLAALAVGLLLAVGLVQVVAHHSPVGQGEPDHFVFLPMVQQNYPPPIINYFQANVAVANPGDTIELSWGTTNAVSVTIYHLLPTGQLGNFWNVAVTGTMSYTISPLARNHTDFMLFASNAGGEWVGAGVQILLTCPDTWFFAPEPDSCPAAPAEFGLGAEQHFEQGTMVWVQSQDLIYVLFADGQSQAWYPYLDEWEEGMPEDDPTIIPPPGYYQPTRGFGLVWREQTGVRDRLGWAIDTESGYETAVQRTSESYSDTYIRATDGNVWRLLPEFSDWEKVLVEPQP